MQFPGACDSSHADNFHFAADNFHFAADNLQLEANTLHLADDDSYLAAGNLQNISDNLLHEISLNHVSGREDCMALYLALRTSFFSFIIFQLFISVFTF